MLIAMIIFMSVMAVIFFTALYTYIRVFHSPSGRDYTVNIPKGEGNKEEELLYRLSVEFKKTPFENVYITSYDKTKLYARYYHMNDGAPVYIQFHGYRSDAMRDFSGGFSTVRARGHNVLVVDQRAHGKSEGRTITFGIRESKDCVEWIKYVLERFGSDTDIFLSGVSMGAATVLMASELQLPENVRGIIADCGYSSPRKIIMKVCADEKLPPRLVYPFIRLGAVVFGGFDISKGSAEEAVGRSCLPILIIHGESDLFVPCDMAREIFKAANARDCVELHTFDGASHGYSFLKDPERYRRINDEFVSRCLSCK